MADYSNTQSYMQKRTLQKRYLEALCDINLDLFLLCPLEHLPKHDVCNLLDLSLGQLSKHNDLIQPEIKAAASQPYKLNHTSTGCRQVCSTEASASLRFKPGCLAKANAHKPYACIV